MQRSKIIVLITCVFLSGHTGFSQINIDSILREQPPSNIELIGRARGMSIDAFVRGDKQEVRKIHHYLFENFENSEFVALFPEEQILLFAWSGDFESLLHYIPKLTTDYHMQIRNKIQPISTNNFIQIARKQVGQELEAILDNLQMSSLSQEQKDFVSIYLRYPLVGNLYYGYYYFVREINYDAIIRQINADTRTFLATYPNSEYINFLKSYELELNDWGFWLGMSAGYSLKTNNLSDYIKSFVSVEIFLEVMYKKYMVGLGFFMIDSRARENIIKQEGWVLPKDTSVNMNNFYLSFGYKFFENKRVEITPTAGIGTTWMQVGTSESRKRNPELKHFNYSYGLTTSLGVSADIRLTEMLKIPGQDLVYPPWARLRVSYKFSYNTLKQNIPVFYNGNLHTIAVGICIGGKGVRRINYN
ncbi:MAG: hypothetical protein LBH22_01505 [Bacteroidales bacterium]|jgi:hypothetical protein|nr:hypothetical protein [Bacteroidales bacterium]